MEDIEGGQLRNASELRVGGVERAKWISCNEEQLLKQFCPRLVIFDDKYTVRRDVQYAKKLVVNVTIVKPLKSAVVRPVQEKNTFGLDVVFICERLVTRVI